MFLFAKVRKNSLFCNRKEKISTQKRTQEKCTKTQNTRKFTQTPMRKGIHSFFFAFWVCYSITDYSFYVSHTLLATEKMVILVNNILIIYIYIIKFRVRRFLTVICAHKKTVICNTVTHFYEHIFDLFISVLFYVLILRNYLRAREKCCTFVEENTGKVNLNRSTLKWPI